MDPAEPLEPAPSAPRHRDDVGWGGVLGVVGLVVVLLLVFWPTVREWIPWMSPPSTAGFGSATKAGMQNLKTALTQYCADLGRYPHPGSTYDAWNLDRIGDVLQLDGQRNVLVVAAPRNLSGWRELGLPPGMYARRWKGPYMETTPDDFMADAWQRPFRLRVCKQQLWIWSAGQDGSFVAPSTFENMVGNPAFDDPGVDDIVMSIARLSGPGFASSPAATGGLDQDLPLSVAPPGR